SLHPRIRPPASGQSRRSSPPARTSSPANASPPTSSPATSAYRRISPSRRTPPVPRRPPIPDLPLALADHVRKRRRREHAFCPQLKLGGVGRLHPAEGVLWQFAEPSDELLQQHVAGSFPPRRLDSAFGDLHHHGLAPLDRIDQHGERILILGRHCH